MVNIWQAHIREWSEATDESTVQPPDPPPAPNISQRTSSKEPQRKGHVLRPTNEGGMFCVKCGKQTKFTKHVRLKILNKACANKDLPREQWLATPGRMQATSRLDVLQNALQNDLNKGNHQVVWNRKNGKDATKPESYGLIFCLACGRTWPWMRRHNTFSKTTCRPVHPAPSCPTWVTPEMKIPYQGTPPVQPDVPMHAPRHRQRLRRKTPANASPNTNPIAAHAELDPAHAELPSGSRDIPRVGVG